MKKRIVSMFKVIMLVLLFLFTTLYISNENGYYAYTNHQRNILTEESIKRFENDVAIGNAIDVSSYLGKEKDYTNNISKISLNISNKIGGLIRKGIVNFFEKITRNIK